jgi:hypothetical protein
MNKRSDAREKQPHSKKPGRRDSPQKVKRASAFL